MREKVNNTYFTLDNRAIYYRTPCGEEFHLASISKEGVHIHSPIGPKFLTWNDYKQNEIVMVNGKPLPERLINEINKGIVN